MAASPVAAQENPFAFTGGKVKSAYIVYDLVGNEKQPKGSTFEIGVTPDRMIIRARYPVDMGGKKDTLGIIAVTTRDSQYTVTTMQGKPDGEVSPLLRPHLAREYAGLNAAAKARFRENLKLAVQTGGSSDVEQYITLVGDKLGSETVAGHKCDVYKDRKVTMCVMPQAPGVILKWASEENGLDMVARKVTLNGPIPPAASVLPKGLKWRKKAVDDADFITNVWMLKKQTDPEGVPPATLAQFTVRYLATPEATAEFRAMQPDASSSEDASSEEEASEDGATSEDGS
ncbi:MAG: hypothetical protein QOH59_2816 [Gemmatimonadales bacterium]|nr:hypothetical protein [Gemmatimonadales bacterium]